MTRREMLQALREGGEGFMHVQGFDRVSHLPKIMVEAAYIGYDVMGHSDQTLKRLQQRGGFGIGEVAYYMAFAVLAGRVKISFSEERERKMLDREIRT
jgi:hypothetical protein